MHKQSQIRSGVQYPLKLTVTQKLTIKNKTKTKQNVSNAPLSWADNIVTVQSEIHATMNLTPYRTLLNV